MREIDSGAGVMRKLAAAFLMASAASHAAPAFAWGDEGHKVIALIAERNLTPTAAQRVHGLLAGPALPGHPTDRAEVPSDIASRATWPDKYRDSDRRPDDPTSRYSMTREWHFVDLELDGPDLAAACFGHPVPPQPFPGRADNCAVDKIKQFTAVLKDPAASNDDKTVALEFLLHFVGDIHQPLHAADHHDQGGNAEKIKYTFKVGGKAHSATTSLHGYWDKVTVSRLGSTPETIANDLAAGIPAQPSGAWLESDPAAWANESFSLAKTKAYTPAMLHSSGTVAISATYATAATGVARRRLQLAGFRLARLLNDALQ